MNSEQKAYLAELYRMEGKELESIRNDKKMLKEDKEKKIEQTKAWYADKRSRLGK